MVVFFFNQLPGWRCRASGEVDLGSEGREAGGLGWCSPSEDYGGREGQES